MKYKLVIATNNMHKMRELRELFASYPIELLSLKDIGIAIEVEETGTTFAENALLKAEAVAKRTDLPVMSDDSGIEIMALGNFPGIRSARFMAGHSYLEKNQAIIDMLKPYADKSSQFHCVIALCNVEEKPLIFEGITKGRIDSQSRGKNGFGYDPIFISDELKESFGLVSEEEKNSVSHRGKAVHKLIEYLKNKIDAK